MNPENISKSKPSPWLYLGLFVLIFGVLDTILVFIFINTIVLKNLSKSSQVSEKSKEVTTVTAPFDNLNQVNEVKNPELQTHSKDAIYRYGKWHEPGTAGYYYELGFDKWINTKDFKAAGYYYKKALEIDPNYPPALSSYGFILAADENKFKEGEAYLLRAIELDPTWAYAPYNLALVYDIAGNWEKSKEWIDYTTKNFKDHPDYSYFMETFATMKEFHGETN